MQSKSVQIVLATYNGARFLPAQLDSILAQQDYFSEILVCDDGSTDTTLDVIAQYVSRYPGKIRVVPKKPGQRGAAANFSNLLECSTADYVLLCDQDDVWDEDKIQSLTARMDELELQHGAGKPLLLHSDLRVVDEQLRQISASLFEYQNLDKNLSSLAGCLCQNSVTGCTVIVNRALIRLALPVAPQAVMHDWWLALVAAAFGRVEFLDRPFIRYRQHASNTLGAKGWGIRRIAQTVPKAFSRQKAADALRPIIVQADAFSAAYAAKLGHDQQSLARSLGTMPQASPVARLWRAASLRLKKQGLLRTLGMYWFLLIADFDTATQAKRQ
jgi:glycosyltransferase involved in cell wall biosynthesis